MRVLKITKAAITAFSLAVLAMPALATSHFNTTVLETSAETMQIPLFQSRVVQLEATPSRVSVGNADIADILILRGNQVYVLGKAVGTTNVLLWDRSDNLIGALNVLVSHDTTGLKAQLNDLVPGEKVTLHSANGALVLGGQISSAAAMDAIIRVAEAYSQQLGDKEADAPPVVNLMTVGGVQQVMLDVKVAEMERTLLRRFGMKFHALDRNGDRFSIGGVGGGATFPDVLFAPDNVRIPILDGTQPYGPVIDEFAPTDLSIVDKGLVAGFMTENFQILATLEAAKDNGLVKILAEPTLTTMSGQPAEFISGGEFPIPVPDADRGITIQFKEFGVGVKFVPTVLHSGSINLKLNISVSELSTASAVGITPVGTQSTLIVPALTKRAASSSVELADGQTMAIAGLINEDIRGQVARFPGLADIPILGHLFRSQEFQKGETELLILVTPRLAKPIPHDEIRLPTDGYIEPNPVEFYFLGQIEGTPPDSASSEESGPEDGFGQTVD